MSKQRLVSRLLLPTVPLAIASVPTAQAAIVYVDIADTQISGTASLYLSLTNGTVSPTYSPAAQARLTFSGNIATQPLAQGYITTGNYGYVSTSASYATKFTASQNIAPTFGYSFQTVLLANGANGNWTNDDSQGYLGFTFDSDLSTGGSSYHTAWVRVSYNTDRSLTIYDFAYETTPNTAIIAGAIPEPSTYAALAGLLAGSAALYRRRKHKVAGSATAEATQAE
jgi:hypothetical protein